MNCKSIYKIFTKKSPDLPEITLLFISEFTDEVQLHIWELFLGHVNGKGRIGKKNRLPVFVFCHKTLLEPCKFFKFLRFFIGFNPAGFVDG